MKFYNTEFDGVMIIEPDVFEDERGSFTETWNWESFNAICPKLLNPFVQDNQSISKKGVFRGMHWQTPPLPQSKLVRCIKGKIYDIVLCLIKNSPNYGKYTAFEISEENRRQIFIPRGYAHGFIAVGDENIVSYKVDNYWNKDYERCLNVNNLDLSALNIEGFEDLNVIVSEKDKQGISFEELDDKDIFYYVK